VGQLRLIVTDIDGCVGKGEGQPYESEVLMSLANMNRAAQHGQSVPALTLCTGRPAGYVDAMMQVVNGFVPAIFESGAGLYFPDSYRFDWNPAIFLSARKVIMQARELLENEIIQTSVGYFQPGKEMSLTLLPMSGYTLYDVGQAATSVLDGWNLPCSVEVSVTTVEVRLDGVDKGEGIKWMAAETGIPLSSMAGVGDAIGDIAFLSLVGFSAAPSNAEPEVKALVDYVSPYEYEQGFLDIVERCGGRLACHAD
jgi:hydroxymethylpyrimidine pyrophosphatase-like HAD family hydrolase